MPGRYTGPPMTLAKREREGGARSVSCHLCHHAAVHSADAWSDALGAIVRPAHGSDRLRHRGRGHATKPEGADTARHPDRKTMTRPNNILAHNNKTVGLRGISYSREWRCNGQHGVTLVPGERVTVLGIFFATVYLFNTHPRPPRQLRLGSPGLSCDKRVGALNPRLSRVLSNSGGWPRLDLQPGPADRHS